MSTNTPQNETFYNLSNRTYVDVPLKKVQVHKTKNGRFRASASIEREGKTRNLSKFISKHTLETLLSGGAKKTFV